MELKVQKREPGKVKKLLKEGFVPGVVYGKHIEKPILVKFKKTDFIKLYREAGTSTPITLKGEDFEQLALIHDYQLEPVKDMLIHVDFLWIKAWEKVVATVPVVIEWVENLQKQGLEINLVTDEVEVEAIPSKLPHEIKINVADLKDGDNITVWDLNLWEGVKIISDPEEVIVTVYNPSEQSEETSEEEVNEAGESEETNE